MTTFRVQGLAELDRALRELPEATQREVLEPAITEGAGVLRAGMERRVSRRKGTLAAGLVVDVTVFGPRAIAKVGPRGKLEYRGRFLEFGTNPHAIRPSFVTTKARVGKMRRRGKVDEALALRGRTKRALAFDGRVVGRVHHPGAPPKPFMRPALEQDGPRAVYVFGRRMWHGIERITKRLHPE